MLANQKVHAESSRFKAKNKPMHFVIRAKKTMLMVFRATRKLMVWYLEQQLNW